MIGWNYEEINLTVIAYVLKFFKRNIENRKIVIYFEIEKSEERFINC